MSLDHNSVDVFRLYDGRSLAVAVDTLRPLTVCGEELGLVVRAGLAGLVPTGEGELGVNNFFSGKISDFQSKLFDFQSKLFNFESKLFNFQSKLFNFQSKLFNFQSKLLDFLSK